MITAYYKLAAIPDELKLLNKIKSKARLDCIAYAGNYSGLASFINKQGQLFFYKIPAREIAEANTKRLAEWALTGGESLNFSSLFIEDFDFKEYAYGYPNKSPFIGKDRKPNPLFAFRNDAYLFITNADYSVIELLIIPDGRNLISHYYQHLIDGNFDAQINQLRANANPFFNYKGLDICL